MHIVSFFVVVHATTCAHISIYNSAHTMCALVCSLRRFFKEPGNLTKLRNIVSTYVWGHLDDGYSQGMCDLLAPLLVVLRDEALTYACFQCLMKTAILLFPPHTDMNSRLSNLKALLQVGWNEYITRGKRRGKL